MREIFTYGSVGRALRKRCLYPELDSQDRADYQESVIIKSIYCREHYWVSWLSLTAGVGWRRIHI